MTTLSVTPHEDRMTALVWTGPNEAELRRVPVPEPTEGEVLLAVKAAGVCGSDLHGYRGHSPLRTPPYVLGHEVVAEDAGGNLHVLNPLTGCGTCVLCTAGTPNLCPDRVLFGLNRPGTFADYISAPIASLQGLPSGLSPAIGTLAEPLAPAASALAHATVDEQTVVVVLGCGAIGLLAAHMARVRGASLVVSHDVDEKRVAHANSVAHSASTDWLRIEQQVRDASGGLGAAIVIDAVGIEQTWARAIEVLRPGGQLLEIGLGQATGSFAVGDVVRKGITVRGVYAYTPAEFSEALAVLAAHPIVTDWVEIVPLGAGVETLAMLGRGEGPAKAVFVP